MSRENQMEQYKSLIASTTQLGHATEDVSGFGWLGSNIPEAQSVGHHKLTVYPEMLRRALENTNEYPLHESQKRASVKFNLAPMPQSFNLPAVFSVYMGKVGASSQSLVAAVDMLVSIVGENEHQSITSLTSEDYQRLTRAQDKLTAIVGEDENHFLIPLIKFIGNLIKIHDEESNPPTQADLLSQETDDPEHADAATLKPHRPEKAGRPATLPRLKLADLLSQETDDPEHADAATLKPHRPEKVGRPATLPRLKLADLLSQETDDSASGEIDTGPAVGNEV
jgi:hypothetical protein